MNSMNEAGLCNPGAAAPIQAVRARLRARGAALGWPGGHVARNTLILLASTLAVSGISIPFVAFLARALGVEGFGAYSVAFTFAHLSTMVVDMGTGKLLTREISARETKGPAVIGALMAPKPGLFAIALCSSLIAGQALGYSGSRSAALGLSAAIAALMATATAARAVFHAYQRMEYDVIGMVAERIVTISGAVVAIQLGQGVLGVLAAVSLGNLADALLSWRLVRRRFVPSFSIPGGAQVWHHLREGFPLFLAGLFSTLYLRSNVVMLDRMLGSAAAGWYNAAFQLLALVIFIPQMLGLAIFPVFSRLAGQDKEALNAILQKGVWMMALGGALCALGVALVAGWLVPLLYSAPFAPSVIVLRILVLGLPCTFVASLLAQALVATGRQGIVGRATIVAAAVNVALNLILIRALGVNGAAYSAVFTEIALVAQYVLAFIRAAKRPCLTLGGAS